MKFNSRCFRIAICLFMALCMSMPLSAAIKTPVDKPDFAFPKKVVKESVAKLDRAIRSGDDILAIRLLMDYAIAQSSVGKDYLPLVISRIDSVMPLLRNGSSKSILSLLKAKIYLDIYEGDSYKYNDRKIPLFPISKDYTEWSGEQFRHVISGLCDESLENPSALKSVRLADLRSIIGVTDDALVYYPTLYDFIVYENIDIRENLSDFSNIFSVLLLTPRESFILQPYYVPTAKEAENILSLYSGLLKFHEGNTAPLIMADVNRIEFIKNGVYYSMEEAAEKSSYRLLMELHRKYSASEYSGLALDAIKYYDLDNNAKTEFYNTLKAFCRRFPNYKLIDCLKNDMASIERKSIRLNAGGYAVPNKDFRISVNQNNVNDVTLKIYSVDSSPFENGVNFEKSNPKPVKEIKVHFDGTVPFSATRSVAIQFPKPGNYVVTASADGISAKRISYISKIICSEIAMGLLSDHNDFQSLVVNSSDGRPVKDADILFSNFRGANKVRTLGRTDIDGLFDFTLNKENGQIVAKTDGNNYSQVFSVYGYGSWSYEWQTSARTFTALPIYRPGETVEFNSVLYQTRRLNERLYKDKNVRAILRNTNYMAVDTLELKTDGYGRISGKFDIPEGELTGLYYIDIADADKEGSRINSQPFTVSDYKLPTFFVKIESVLQSTPAKGDVTVKGICKTYSGIGLGGVQLKLILSASQRPWWRASNSVDFYSESDTTASDGNFTVVFPSSLFENSPAPDGLFSLKVDATTASGESCQTVTSFSQGNAVDLEASLPDNLDISKPVRLNVRAVRSDNQTVDTVISYMIRTKRDSIIASGNLRSADPSIDLSKIPSGEYSMTLRVSGNMSDSVDADPVVFYRPTDKQSPVSANFWMPYDYYQTLKFGSDRKASFLYATNNPETYILMSLFDGPRSIKREWIKASPGMHRYVMTVPADVALPAVSFCNVTDFHFSSYEMKLEFGKRPAVRIIAESFRDKVVPGTEETWTFRTVDQDSSSIASAMILDMYNGALDALKAPDWSFNPVRSDYNLSNYRFPWGNYDFSVMSPLKNYRCPAIPQPQLELYGLRSFCNGQSMMRALSGFAPGMQVANTMMMKSAAAPPKAMELADAMLESENDEGAALEEVVVTGYGANTASKAEVKTAEFEYRDAETPLAFYKPMLNTDANGNLSFSYRVPNANTTWRFRALAYTDSLLTDLFSADVVANKPIMVQPNLPRFVRTGDRIDVTALVINNSDKEQTVSTHIEIYDPATGRLIQSADTAVIIKAGGSTTSSIGFVAPDDVPFVGYRVKSTGECFADGEQSLIPVLPSSQPVIETDPFYISPDSTRFSMTLPETGEDAVVTLQYCDNPTWLAVTALPGLRTKSMSTPSDAADAIFSAAVAEGLLKDYPAVEDALKQWTSGDQSDSTLVSMLEKNTELKTMLLKATPWMVDAMSDTERMQRLALLFDRKEIAGVYSSAVKLLQKLQRDNGGWAWISQSDKASRWATEQALFTLGYLNSLGYLPSNRDLNRMIEDALAWDQTETLKEYRKYPKSSFHSFLVLRDQWPSIKPSAEGQRIISLEVQKIVRDWKKYSVAGKAEAIRLLYNNGYRRLSKTVLSSLLEFAVSSPEKGMWWPSVGDSYGGSLLQLGISADALFAISKVEPQSTDIDAIRQWLILQKEAQNWGSGSMTTQIVAAIIMTSPKWIQKASDVEIFIGDKKLDVTYKDNLIGDYKKEISDCDPSGKTLSVIKSEGTPSWGAVYSRSVKRMDNIKASSCDAVDIEKRFYKSVGDRWEEVSDFKIGDRIKIQLLIHAERDMQYMTVDDERAACFEPVEQLPAPIWSEGLCFYRENRDSSTNLFVTNMPKGTYLLEYEMWVNNSGEFSSGIATIQSQYAPQLSAHSSGRILNVVP